MYKLSIAFRYLARRRIAYVSIVAIAFGVMAMIVVTSVMDGFQRRIKNSIRSVDGDVSVALNNRYLRRGERHFAMVKDRLEPFMVENGGPVVAISKRVNQHAMISTTAVNALVGPGRPPRQEYVQLMGIDIAMERAVLPLDDMLDAAKDFVYEPTEGEGEPVIVQERRVPEWARANPFEYWPPGAPFPGAQPGIVLGSVLADRLAVGVGDLVKIITARTEDAVDSEVEFVEQRYIVTGCFQSGRYDYDLKLAFCSGEVLQQLLGMENDCGEVRLKLTDSDLADEFKRDTFERYGAAPDGLDAWTWKDQMKPLAEALAFEKLAMLIVLACIIAVAGACIGGILYMVVLEKTRDIGILMSMGATSRGVVAIFLIYGGFLGLIGTALGVLGGLEVVWHLDGIIEFIEDLTSSSLFPPDIYEFRSLPTHYEVGDIARVALVTLLWCVFAAFVPALRAARLDPLKCLVYE